MGDFSLLGGLMPDVSSAMLNESSVHWDWTVPQPTILLDDDVFVEKAKIYL